MSELFQNEIIEELGEYRIPRLSLEDVSREAEKMIEELGIKRIIERRGEVREKLSRMGLLGEIREWSGGGVCSLAVDTSFTKPGIELVSGCLIVILRSHVLVNCRNNSSIPDSDSVGTIIFTRGVESIAAPASKIYERKLVLEALREKKRGNLDLKVIFIDGELFPRTPPGYSRGGGGVMRIYRDLVSITIDVVREALETDTALVGVVKRSYSRDLAAILGDPGVRVNDKTLATLVLEPGEYIRIGSYGRIRDCYIGFLREHEEVLGHRELRSLRERLEWITSVSRESGLLESINNIVYKARNPSYFMIATRIEYVESRSMGESDIVSYASSITGVNGVPHLIDVVDSMCSVKPEFMHVIQQRLLEEVFKRVGDSKAALAIAGLTNPEKLRRIGF